ncbi:GntR family transcriptional regulator [Mariniflexile sp. HMF6888]|uniref:GntR family transcriptional regulator n=1 Tax=Mariniflexile sp. HMF6888 TaxID=3373086 RepID=UPI0037A358E7
MKTISSSLTAYQIILDKIINNELKPGEVITEVSLSEKLGLSRTPVRDAVQRLEMEGLVVTENRTKKIYYLTPLDIENIFDLKISIESTIARLAAEKGTDKQMNELGDIVLTIHDLLIERKNNPERMDHFFERWIEADKKFHAKLFEISDNQRAEQIITTLNTQWHRIKMGLSAIEGRIEKSAFEHKAIGNAIISRKPEEAEQAVIKHLTNLKDVLLKIMQAFNI